MGMTPEEMDLARKKAREELNAEMEGKSPSPTQTVNEEAPIFGGLFGRNNRKAAEVGKDVPTAGNLIYGQSEEQAPKSLKEMMLRGAQAADDLVRKAANGITGGMADKIASKAGGTELDEELAKTNMAGQRTGLVGDIAEGAGTLASAALLPGGATATIPRAMATGGIGAGANAVTQALGRDEAPDPMKVAVSAGTGAVGAGLGKYVGDRLGRLLERKMGDDPTQLWEQAGKRFEEMKKTTDTAYKTMTDAGVKVDSSYLGRGADVLRKQLEKRPLFTIGKAPYAKAALGTIDDFIATKPALKLDDINDLRRSIRDSILDTNGTWRDNVEPQDARLVQWIDGKISDLMKNLPNAKNAVVAGDAKKGIEGFVKMNENVPLQTKASIIANAFDRADLRTGKGVSFDQALQNEFIRIYESKMGKSEFRGPGLKLIRDAAKGNIGTQWLNSLDRAYGHGGLFSFVWNTINKVPRAAMGEAAETNARNLFKELTTQELNRAGAQGGLVGTVAGAAGGASLGDLMPPVSIQSPIVPRQ